MEKNVGKRILEVRTKRDYTQEELAEKGVVWQVIYQI